MIYTRKSSKVGKEVLTQHNIIYYERSKTGNVSTIRKDSCSKRRLGMKRKIHKGALLYEIVNKWTP
jgi:hypothetical protein